MPDELTLLPEPPADWADVYRQLVLRELAFDFRVAFAIEYYAPSPPPTWHACSPLTARCSATPRPAQLFDSTIGVLAGRLPKPLRPLI